MIRQITLYLGNKKGTKLLGGGQQAIYVRFSFVVGLSEGIDSFDDVADGASLFATLL